MDRVTTRLLQMVREKARRSSAENRGCPFDSSNEWILLYAEKPPRKDV